MLYLLLLTGSAVVLSWSIVFDQASCEFGYVPELDVGTDIYEVMSGTTCRPGGGIIVNSCATTFNKGGPFILDSRNPNVSVEVDFYVPHPLPNVTTLVTIRGKQDVFTSTQRWLTLEMYANTSVEDDLGFIASHFFMLKVPSLLTRTGYCDQIMSSTQLFSNQNFTDIMAEMAAGSSALYQLKAMLVQTQDDPVPILLVRLRAGSNEGWSFSLSNLGSGEARINQYIGGTESDADYAIGCGVTVYRVSINTNVVLPEGGLF